jgi:hypothetical protein
MSSWCRRPRPTVAATGTAHAGNAGTADTRAGTDNTTCSAEPGGAASLVQVGPEVFDIFDADR